MPQPHPASLLAAQAALFEHAQELVADLVKRAKRGEPAATRLVLQIVADSEAGGRRAQEAG
jgi:hypothetical protein